MKIEDQSPGPARRTALRRFPIARGYRVLGRFRTWRWALSQWERLPERLAAASGRKPGGTVPQYHAEQSLFSDFRSDEALQRLRQQGVCGGLQLPPILVDQIAEYALAMPCRRHSEDHEHFRIGEVKNGLSPLGAPVGIADVIAPGCPAVDTVTHDPVLIEIVRRYLGRRPRRVARRLYWSPVSTLPDEARRNNGQTIDYHYDIEPHNSLYVFFYITGADRNSGAHVAIMRSHRSKPLPIIWSSAFQPDARVLDRYGADSPVVIEGGPGYGFLEDPACFHKALPPKDRDRLVLQFRYS